MEDCKNSWDHLPHPAANPIVVSRKNFDTTISEKREAQAISELPWLTQKLRTNYGIPFATVTHQHHLTSNLGIKNWPHWTGRVLENFWWQLQIAFQNWGQTKHHRPTFKLSYVVINHLQDDLEIYQVWLKSFKRLMANWNLTLHNFTSTTTSRHQTKPSFHVSQPVSVGIGEVSLRSWTA